MPKGPGKYDHLATMVRLEAEAEGVIVLIMRGNQGSGFSVQGHEDLVDQIPTLLRRIADEMDASGKTN